MRQKDFEQHISMLLRDLPPGMVADLDGGLAAYWNGYQVVYVFLSEDGTGEVVEEFDLNDFVWSDLDPGFTRWSASPKFTERQEVKNWRKESPPQEAG